MMETKLVRFDEPVFLSLFSSRKKSIQLAVGHSPKMDNESRFSLRASRSVAFWLRRGLWKRKIRIAVWSLLEDNVLTTGQGGVFVYPRGGWPSNLHLPRCERAFSHFLYPLDVLYTVLVDRKFAAKCPVSSWDPRE